MIRVTPLVSMDIIGRYAKMKGGIIDNFTNTLIRTKNKRQQAKVYNQLNTVGLVNSSRLQRGLALRTIAVA